MNPTQKQGLLSAHLQRGRKDWPLTAAQSSHQTAPEAPRTNRTATSGEALTGKTMMIFRASKTRLHLTAWRIGNLIGQPSGGYRVVARIY